MNRSNVESYLLTNFNALCRNPDTQSLHFERGKSAASCTPSIYYQLGENVINKAHDSIDGSDEPRLTIGAYFYLGVLLEQLDADGGELRYNPLEQTDDVGTAEDHVAYQLAKGLHEREAYAGASMLDNRLPNTLRQRQYIASYQLGICLVKQFVDYTHPPDNVFYLPFSKHNFGDQ